MDNLAPSGKRESYVGILKEVEEDYICVELSSDGPYNAPVKSIYVVPSLVLSVWEYSIGGKNK